MRHALALALAAVFSVAGFAATAQAEDEGFVSLFDGKSLQGWTPVNSSAGNWLVQDGLLVTKGQGGGWLSTDKVYKDFTLKLEFRVEKGGNSGVFIRSPHSGDPAYSGMELQVLDDDDDQYKTLKPFQYTGSVYGVVAAKRGHTKAPGEWNQMEITAKGSKITVKLNGTTIVDADLSEHSDAAKAHPGILRADGYVGLQSHSDPVKFRNISIKELK
ncbi:3-keto-disaccharide hydrolase [Singulisphaera sp. PoT]|uniref:3-keto-disaccharide hydrolase n=1 Tax=Singulisphaera sp. PoT TaxID=3411797 RepID=UPI003BF59C81